MEDAISFLKELPPVRRILETVAERGSVKKDLYLLHGVLMSVSFGIILPAGMLAALLRKFPSIGRKATWFQAHRAIQLVATLLVVAAFIIAVAKFEDSIDGEYTSTYRTHKVAGIVVLGLVLVNSGSGLFRSTVDHPLRPKFNRFHSLIGKVSNILGSIVCVIGAKLYRDVTGDSSTLWIVLLVLSTVVYLLITIPIIAYLRRTQAMQSKLMNSADGV